MNKTKGCLIANFATVPEYVEHFCGLECYQRFQARASTATETSVKPDACDSPPSG
ncbi:DUF3330 domain-containing protein [Klebsiella pneumoniae]|uniref:DUF3330 domain-containing protein n=1 Tax=Klebsiella pneumoniae TaxID=573 RepID=UPI002AFE7F26|nr:DUF3330 domain-containing protein [Klebsiella pneumoniae]